MEQNREPRKIPTYIGLWQKKKKKNDRPVNKQYKNNYLSTWKKYKTRIISTGVPTVAQRVKNLTTVAWVSAVAQVWSSAQFIGLKDLALSELWLRFSLWLRNVHMPWVQPYKKKKKKKLEFPLWYSGNEPD